MAKKWKQPVWLEKLSVLTWQETLQALVKAAGLTAVFAWMFYRSWIGGFLYLLLAPVCLWVEQEEKRNRERQQLSVQFLDMIQAMAGSLQAGYSVENAFLEAYREIAVLFGKKCRMALEMDKVRKGLENRIPMEVTLAAFGEQSQVEEIRDFTEVFMILKRSGGNLREMIRRTVELTRQRMEVEQEIARNLTSRQFEMKIMCAVPFLMYGYVQLTSPGYFDVLYHNAAGILIMTACMAVYMSAAVLSWKIMKICV